MGIFDKFKSSATATTEKVSPWIPLEQMSQLDEMMSLSFDKKVVVFKHSTRCGISASVIRKFEAKLTDEVAAYYFDLLNFRAISNEIAERWQVIHESPQLIVLEQGKVTAYASHYDILELNI